MNKNLELKSERNYGLFSDASKTLNLAFGDQTGRSVSMRTAQGFQSLFNLQNIHEDTAEDIVHLGMVSTIKLINSKKNDEKLLGCFIGFTLIISYFNGK